jgi:cytochrome c-type biogenesis protein CcmE
MMTDAHVAPARSGGRTKFLIGGLLIVAAIVYLIASSTQASAQYYLTIDELAEKGESVRGRDLKISGAVDGDSIVYEPETLTLRFTVANVPAELEAIEESGGLAEVLHQAVSDPNARRLQVVYIGVKPDLRHEAQAIMTRRMD